jgi:hypothetical protein
LRRGNRQRVRLGQEPVAVRAYARADLNYGDKDGLQVIGPWTPTTLSRWLDAHEQWWQRSREEWAQFYHRMMRK